MKACYEKFSIKNTFRCPKCGAALSLSLQSLLCENGHCFDVAKKGYVNLALGRGGSLKYDKTLFESRGIILKAGFYAHILEAAKTLLSEAGAKRILDAGCGEGYYARALAAEGMEVYAFDLAKDAVALAAEGGTPVKLMVADMTAIPLADGSMDAILDAFSPAHYGEYKRVLKDAGRIVKIIPAENHLKELRAAAAPFLRHNEYENGADVEAHFSSHFRLLQTMEAERTFPLTDDLLPHLLRMTPLLFGVDATALPLDTLREITVAAKLLIGEKE
ncbi:MAG: methyltransferase domain-containing protein [Clostridiales bacterium]|nr:methyltransferase domain-containing protein [Clostridiales bacterium]